MGTVIRHVFSYVKEKQKNEQILSILREERALLKMEIEGRDRVAHIEAESVKDVAESNAFSASFDADEARYSAEGSHWLVMVDVVRGLIRPILTLGLIIFVAIIWATADDPLIDKQIVTTVLYVCTAAVLWWFGTRVKRH